MCDKITYRSAGAETLVRIAAINILLRWSKGGRFKCCIGQSLVQLNLRDEPISYIELTLKKDSNIALLFGVDFYMHGELPYSNSKRRLLQHGSKTEYPISPE